MTEWLDVLRGERVDVPVNDGMTLGVVTQGRLADGIPLLIVWVAKSHAFIELPIVSVSFRRPRTVGRKLVELLGADDEDEENSVELLPVVPAVVFKEQP